MNLDLVERASLVIRSAVANAMDWGDIELLVKDAQARGDPIAMAIQGLKLKTNEITLLLRYHMLLIFNSFSTENNCLLLTPRDPSEDWDSDDDEELTTVATKKKVRGLIQN